MNKGYISWIQQSLLKTGQGNLCALCVFQECNHFNSDSLKKKKKGSVNRVVQRWKTESLFQVLVDSQEDKGLGFS